MLIMKITEFIKKELSGWNRFEILGLFFIFCTLLYNVFVLHDSLTAVCSALCGILYSVFAGKGKLSCYFFGLTGSGCYVALAITNHFWGNALLYLLYFIPMQVHGIFEWKKHLHKESNEIIKSKLNVAQRLKLMAVCVSGCVITVFLLTFLSDKSPFFDGIATFLSVIAMYLTVKRLIEQWIIWATVNFMSFLMWMYLVINGVKVYSTLVMWGFYCILAVYFYIVWRKELQIKQ